MFGHKYTCHETQNFLKSLTVRIYVKRTRGDRGIPYSWGRAWTRGQFPAPLHSQTSRRARVRISVSTARLPSGNKGNFAWSQVIDERKEITIHQKDPWVKPSPRKYFRRVRLVGEKGGSEWHMKQQGQPFSSALLAVVLLSLLAASAGASKSNSTTGNSGNDANSRIITIISILIFLAGGVLLVTSITTLVSGFIVSVQWPNPNFCCWTQSLNDRCGRSCCSLYHSNVIFSALWVVVVVFTWLSNSWQLTILAGALSVLHTTTAVVMRRKFVEEGWPQRRQLVAQPVGPIARVQTQDQPLPGTRGVPFLTAYVSTLVPPAAPVVEGVPLERMDTTHCIQIPGSQEGDI
ncbi:hypothetical protein BSKO_10247 [Bryopsis sp. KO-2023]|nr:hypothetical protein BSKO_10247 [Bryopsis sp. KO-2023]